MFSTDEKKQSNSILSINESGIGRKSLPLFNLKTLAYILIIVPLFLIFVMYYKIVWYEIKYRFIPKSYVVLEVKNEDGTNDDDKIIKPIDPNFSIVIPKLGVNTPVVKDIDPYNPVEYQRALAKGVAHAKDSAIPFDVGNVFLFAHSSANFYEASRFNAVFYLINKLEKSDRMYLSFENKIYTYEVEEVKHVNANQIDIISPKTDNQQLTLMTCWPPGTNISRLVVIGKLIEVK